MPTPNPRPTTRLAPSPTGALHLGNARTFVINWILARQLGWDVVLRIEDLDTTRVKPGVIDQTINTLSWLGLDWDSDPIIQSDDLPHHNHAMDALASRSLVYPCALSRKQIKLATNAPNEGDAETRFPPELRPPSIPTQFNDAGTNWRLITHPDPITFHDEFTGPHTFNPGESAGDFVVWTQRQTPSYQLAVVVDDHRQGITHIVRGDDLLDSTARQIILQRHLGLPTPKYYHLPLIRNTDGRRLAKRHDDPRLEYYQDANCSPERILGLIAYWSGVLTNREEITLQSFLERFKLDTLPTHDLVFTEEDDQWLRS